MKKARNKALNYILKTLGVFLFFVTIISCTGGSLGMALLGHMQGNINHAQTSPCMSESPHDHSEPDAHTCPAQHHEMVAVLTELTNLGALVAVVLFFTYVLGSIVTAMAVIVRTYAWQYRQLISRLIAYWHHVHLFATGTLHAKTW